MTEANTKPKIDKSKFTGRNVTKFVVKMTVRMTVARVATSVITDYTRFEKDDLITKIGSQVVAWGVSDTAAPYTDKIVDATFDFAGKKISERKTKNEAKKAEKSEKDAKQEEK